MWQVSQITMTLTHTHYCQYSPLANGCVNEYTTKRATPNSTLTRPMTCGGKKKGKIQILITFLCLMATPSACTMKIDRFSALNNIILWSISTQNKYGYTIMSQFLLWNEPQMTPIVVEMPSIHTMTLYPTEKQYTSTQKYSTQKQYTVHF